MGVDKTVTKSDNICAESSAAMFSERGRVDDDNDIDYSDGNHIKEMLEYLDGMVEDIKEIHRQQDEQEKRLTHMEERIDNVNNRMDNIVGGR